MPMPASFGLGVGLGVGGGFTEAKMKGWSSSAQRPSCPPVLPLHLAKPSLLTHRSPPHPQGRQELMKA